MQIQPASSYGKGASSSNDNPARCDSAADCIGQHHSVLRQLVRILQRTFGRDFTNKLSESWKMRTKYIVNGAIFLLIASPLLLPQFRVYFIPSSGFNFYIHVIAFMSVILTYVIAFCLISLPRSHAAPRVIAVVLAMVLFIGAIVAYNVRPIEFPRAIGAPAIYLSFGVFVATLTCAILIRFPKLTLLVLLAIATSTFMRSTHHPVRLSDQAAAWPDFDDRLWNCDRPHAACFFQTWLNNRPDLNAFRRAGMPYPVYLVSAAGGGIYAAAHTYAFLKTVSAMCPAFRQHVFAISSVSGGSFGALYYALDDYEHQIVTEIKGCDVDAMPPANLRMAEDYFSPVLAGFIFSNVIRYFVPFEFFPFEFKTVGSGEALEDAFDASFDKQQANLPLRSLWDATSNTPVLFINVTNAIDGNMEVASPFDLKASGVLSSGFGSGPVPFRPIAANVSALTAAGLSARFPFITPAGQFERSSGKSQEKVSDESRRALYVDGGYVDNGGNDLMGILRQEIIEGSGETIESFPCISDPDSKLLCSYQVPACTDVEPIRFARCISDMWERNVVSVEFYFIQIDSYSTDRVGGTQTALDPLYALLSVRAARSAVAKYKLLYDECGFMLCHDTPASEQPIQYNTFDNDVLNIPLTWSIGVYEYRKLLQAIGNARECNDGQLGEDWEEVEVNESAFITVSNNCTMENLVHRLEARQR